MEAKSVRKICGHASVRGTLDRITQLSIHPQSFLFSGPKHLGKSLVAQEFAEKLIGSPVSSDGFHPDLFILGDTSDDSDSPMLSVEQVRVAQQFLSRFPENGKYRVVIVERAEQLTISAENALLKMLEEPNTSSVIILVSSRPGKLLPTVRSRLFPVNFSLVAPEVLRQFFPESNDLPDFFFSLGLPGLIRRSIQDPESFEMMKNELKKLFQLSRLSWSERIQLAEKLTGSAGDLEQMLSIWLIGLSRRGSDVRTPAEAAFLETIIETIDRISARQGSSRLLLEKLFTAI
ncbi:MAG: hypothetical protein ACEQSB_04555 [Undibacterium sp.]